MKKRPSLFDGFWKDMNGRRLRRLTRNEVAEVWRLWTKHRDIRERRAA